MCARGIKFLTSGAQSEPPLRNQVRASQQNWSAENDMQPPIFLQDECAEPVVLTGGCGARKTHLAIGQTVA
jgi:hypothetical protein